MRGVFFGLEYDNDAVPNAIVIPGTRSGKFIKWVNEYQPVVISRADGKKVLRERRAVQCPDKFHLRRDEVLGQMKERKTENYQDGKFFVVERHTIGKYLHPAKAKMEEAEKEKRDAELNKQRSADLADTKPPVAPVSDAPTHQESVVQSPREGSGKPLM
jgi:hypothetical protein